MVLTRNIIATLALAGSTFAAPRWWAQGNFAKHPSRSAEAQVADTAPSGYVSNGVLYLTTTVYLQPGQTAPAAAPQVPAAASASSLQAPTAQSPPASTSPVQIPAIQSSSPATQVAPSIAPAAPAQSSAASSAPSNQANTGGSGSITADMIIKAAPASQSCANSAGGAECATAAQAASALNAVFPKYGINNAGAQAAVIAWELFESGNGAFTYSKNHFPGTPGQGTRCMMMPTFVQQYATALLGAAKVNAAGSPAAVLDLVNADDQGSFGSGAWYMQTKCPNLIAQFASAPETAWPTFMTSCVGTTLTDQRTAIWNNVKAALGVA